MPPMRESRWTDGDRWLDQPAWPNDDRLELTWIVTEVHDSVDPESSKQPLELVASIGNVPRRLKFPSSSVQ